jgi:hypothetical protein
MHAVAPEAFWYVPGLQRVHAPRPSASVKLPGRQSMHAEELLAPLSGWWVPWPQARQPERLLSLMVSDHVPGSQNLKTEAELAPNSSQ